MNKKNKRKVMGILAISSSVLTATTTAFLVEEAKLNKLISTQKKIWDDLDNFKNVELKGNEFLTKIIKNVLKDNPVLKIYDDTFQQVQLKIDNLKFALSKFKEIINQAKQLDFSKYQKLAKEVEDFLNNQLSYDEYKNIYDELFNTKTETDKHVNSQSTEDELLKNLKILQDAFDNAKRAKAIKDKDIKLLVITNYEKSLRELNDFIQKPLSIEDFYDSLHSLEIANRDKIIKNINPEISTTSDIIKANKNLIKELKDAKQRAYEKSQNEFKRVYDLAKKYANEVLITPDDKELKDEFNKHLDDEYNLVKNENNLDVINKKIKDILNDWEAVKVQKHITDKLRNSAMDLFDEAKKQAEMFLNDFQDNKYSDIKKYVEDIFNHEKQNINAKTYLEIQESAKKIQNAIKDKKQEALNKYQENLNSLKTIKDTLNDPKYESIKTEIEQLITKTDKVANDPNSTTREILDAAESLKNLEKLIENKKQAKNNIDNAYQDIESYINTHTHPESSDLIKKLQDKLNETKEIVKNLSNASEIDNENNKLQKVFEETKNEVNKNFEKRETEKSNYDKVVKLVSDLLDNIKSNSALYPNLAEKLNKTKTETDAVVAKKDTQSTSDDIKQATTKLKATYDEVDAAKDEIDFNKAKETFDSKLSETNEYSNGLDANLYGDIKQELSKKISDIQNTLNKVLNDNSTSKKDKIKAYIKAQESLQKALDDAKKQKEEDDRKAEFRKFESVKNEANNFIKNNLSASDSNNFIKTPLNNVISTESTKLEKDINEQNPEVKDGVLKDAITESITKLQEALDNAKKIKAAKDKYQETLDNAKNKLLDIGTPVLNNDDKNLHDNLLKVINDSTKALEDTNNKTEDNFADQANKLKDATETANSLWEANKAKREAAKTNLLNKINEIKDYVNTNLKNGSETKPEHIKTVEKINKDLEAAKGIYDSSASTEANLIEELNNLNNQEKTLKASEKFDKKLVEASTFANSLTDPLEKNIKDNLESAIELEESNKTKQNADENAVNEATDNLNKAINKAKQTQLDLFQNMYDDLSNKAQELLNSLDETNLQDSQKHPEYPDIKNKLKSVKDTEDARSLSSVNPKPTIETLKDSVKKLKTAYDAAVLTKAKSDFDKKYQDIFVKVNDNKYSEIKKALESTLQNSKNIRDNQQSTASDINKETKKLISTDSNLDSVIEKFDPYYESLNKLQHFKEQLKANQAKYQDIINTIDTSLNANNQESITSNEDKLNADVYKTKKIALDKALEDAKVAKAKKDYEDELNNKLTDNDFDSLHQGAKNKYNAEVEEVKQNLSKKLNDFESDSQTSYKEKIATYKNALNNLLEAKKHVEKNKVIDEYEKALHDANAYKDSLVVDEDHKYQTKIKYDLNETIKANNNDHDHIDNAQNYKTQTQQKIEMAKNNLTQALEDAKTQEALVKKQKDIFDTKKQAIADAMKLYPTSSTTLQEVLNQQNQTIENSINATPPTINADTYKNASDAIDQAIQKAAYKKYNDLLNNVNNYINSDLSDPKYQNIKQELEEVKNSLNNVTETSTKETLDNAYDKLKAAFDNIKAKKAFDDKYNEILNIVPQNTTDPHANYDAIRNKLVNEMQHDKAIRDDQHSTTQAILDVTQDLSKDNDALKNKITEVVNNFNQYNDKVNEATKYKNALDLNQDEAKKIINDALESYKQSNITDNDVLNKDKYNEFKNKLTEALDHAKAVENAKKAYENSKSSVVHDDQFNTNPDALNKYKKEIEDAKNTLTNDLHNANGDWEKIKEAYQKSKDALDQAKNNISKNIAQENYEKKLKESKDLSTTLVDNKDDVTKAATNEDHHKKIANDLKNKVQAIETELNNVIQDTSKSEQEKEDAYNNAKTKLQEAINDAKTKEHEIDEAKKAYDEKVKELNNYKNTLTNENEDIKTSLDTVLTNANNALNTNLHKDPSTIDKQNYLDQTKNLQDALDQAKLNKAKKEYENSKAQATETLNTLNEHPKTKTWYKDTLDKINETLTNDLKLAHTDPEKEQAYLKANEAIKTLNNSLEAKKQEETNAQKQGYDSSKSELETILNRLKNNPAANDIKKELEEAKKKAEKVLVDPKTPTKYQGAKDILDKAIAKAKEDEKQANTNVSKSNAYKTLSDQVATYISSDLSNNKYSNIKDALKSVKDEEDKKSLPTVTPFPSQQTIEESIQKLQTAFDKAKAQKQFDDSYNQILDNIGTDTKYSNLKSNVQNKLSSQKTIRDNQSSTANQINTATQNLNKTTLLNTISQVKTKLDNLLSTKQQLDSSISNTGKYKNDDEIKKYINSVTNSHNENSITGDDILKPNVYQTHTDVLQTAITKAQNIKTNKDAYSQAKTSLETKVHKVTNQDAKNKINAKKTEITNKLTSDITAAANNPEKLAQAYKDAKDKLTQLESDIPKYQKIAEYETKRNEVENYKNSLTKPEYNKIKNKDLLDAITRADNNVNKNSNYANKTEEQIQVQIQALNTAKTNAQSQVNEINSKKQEFETSKTQYTAFKNIANSKTQELQTELTHQETMLQSKIGNNTIDANSYNTATDALKTKAANVYQSLSNEVNTYLTTSPIKDENYKDLKTNLENTKTTQDNIALPQRKPSVKQVSDAYKALNDKYNDTKTKVATRQRLVNSYNSAKQQAEADKNEFTNENNDIQTWFNSEITKIDQKRKDAINHNPSTLSDDMFTTWTNELNNLKVNAQKKLIDKMLKEIEDKLKLPESDRVTESANAYNQLKELKNRLTTLKSNNDINQLKTQNKEISSSLKQHIKTIDDNIKAYNAEHSKAVDKLAKEKTYVDGLTTTLDKIVDYTNTWGKSTNLQRQNTNKSDSIVDPNHNTLSKDKKYFKEKITELHNALPAYDTKAQSKSIMQNKEVNNHEFGKLDSKQLKTYLDEFKQTAITWIHINKIDDPKNGFNGEHTFTGAEGVTKDESTNHLYSDVKHNFIDNYDAKYNPPTTNGEQLVQKDINFEDYVTYRNIWYKSVESYEKEMYKLKAQLKILFGYNDNHQPGTFVQKFRELYRYVHLIAGVEAWASILHRYFHQMVTGVNYYENFDDYQINITHNGKPYTNQLLYSDVYEDLATFQKFDKKGLRTKEGKDDKWSSMQIFIDEINQRRGELQGNYPGASYRLDNYSQYYWYKNANWNKLKLANGKLDTYNFNDYIKFLIKSLLKKLNINEDDPNDELAKQYKQLEMVYGFKLGLNTKIDRTWKKHEDRINNIIDTYFKYIEKKYQPTNGEFKQLVLWDAKGNDASSTHALDSLDYYNPPEEFHF
ncbi:hypothetical protein [Mycoplasma miroungirhinis]|uniref:ECM-binding protein homolog n=1 Tax=Mycoplasma miroungirhinis TaxID=754516 RepID=A0A6M4JB94_9MOLU|nr:hypothetical protein [Mycoplasma miroungirhinis]QJR44190.1 hypothetical protein HLA92_01960 [Mycoplasma miroungirhinis]